MDKNRLNAFLATASPKITAEAIPSLRSTLEQMDDDAAIAVTSTELKDPTLVLIVSILLGTLGVDRFMIGDMIPGVLKLLTGGGCGLWWLIDLFLIMGATKKKNVEALEKAISFAR